MSFFEKLFAKKEWRKNKFGYRNNRKPGCSPKTNSTPLKLTDKHPGLKRKNKADLVKAA
jgi:hypothetical protein